MRDAKIGLEIERLVQQRVRVRERVLMRRDGKRREALGGDVVLRHVGAHQRRVQRQERLAANAFELPIRGRRERARDGVALDVRHALDAADRDGIVNAAGDGLIGRCEPRRRPRRKRLRRSRPRCRRGRCSRRSSRRAAAAARECRRACCRRTARRFAVGSMPASVEGGLDGRRAEIAAAALRVLRDRRLPHAGNEHVSQLLLRAPSDRRASWQRVAANANRMRARAAARPGHRLSCALERGRERGVERQSRDRF